MDTQHPWWGPARVPFLFLTPACMSLAVAWCAWRLHAQGLGLHVWDAVLCVVGALAAHVGVNALNEYDDFKSGLDQRTQRTPFSGGSGVLPAQPALARMALCMGWVGLSLAVCTGVYFVSAHPGLLLKLLPVGLTGLGLVVAYTPWVTRHPWLCLMAPGLGFGPLMWLGTEVVLTGGMSWQGLLLSLLPFTLVNNLLLLNQFPDVDADRSVGRLTLPILLGRAACVPVMAVQYVAGYAVVVLGACMAWWPAGASLAILTAPLALSVWLRARVHADVVSELMPAMGLNVVISLLTPALTAWGVALAA